MKKKPMTMTEAKRRLEKGHYVKHGTISGHIRRFVEDQKCVFKMCELKGCWGELLGYGRDWGEAYNDAIVRAGNRIIN